MSTTKVNINNQSAKKNIRFEHELIEAIESHKDALIPFSAWVKQACKEKLEREKRGVLTSKQENAQVITKENNGVLLTWADNRHELRELAIDLKTKGNSTQLIANYFNELGYLNNSGKAFSRHNITTLFNYKGDEAKKSIKL